MASVQLSARLRTALIELMKIEGSILTTADELNARVSPYPAALALLADIRETAVLHIDAIRVRLRAADSDGGVEPDFTSPPFAENVWLADLHPISSSLRTMFALLNEAIIGYSMIQPIASRFRDSWVIASEGTTGHIARSHTQKYAAFAGRVTDLIHDAVIWELDDQGLECQCTCPACSIGICIGAPSSRSILMQAFAAADKQDPNAGVFVHAPRMGSSAERSGLLPGDVVLSVDGSRIASYSRLQTVIRDHAPNDQIRLKVKRGDNDIVFDVEARSDIHDDRTSGQDECIQPAGEEFAQVQARETYDRLHPSNGEPGNGLSGLEGLTAREIQILRLIAEGANNPMIAAELVISRATVARHVANILAKLRLANRTEAGALAAKAGLLSRV